MKSKNTHSQLSAKQATSNIQMYLELWDIDKEIAEDLKKEAQEDGYEIQLTENLTVLRGHPESVNIRYLNIKELDKLLCESLGVMTQTEYNKDHKYITLVRLGYISTEYCGNCETEYDGVYSINTCPCCGHVEPACNACDMHRCGGCENACNWTDYFTRDSERGTLKDTDRIKILEREAEVLKANLGRRR